MAITLPRINARSLSTVPDAYAFFEGDERAGLVTLLETTEDEADNLLEAARLLGLIDASGNLSELASMMEHASLIDRRTLLRHYLEEFHPFAHWKRRIGQGFEPIDAARHTRAVFDITNSAAEIRDWFLAIGSFCGSIQEDGVKVNPVSGKSIDLGSIVADILNRNESAVASLESYLGPVLWANLPEPAREHLVRAAERSAENAPPDEVIRAVGLAMDAYLSDVGEQDIGGYATQTLTLGATVNQLLQDGVTVTKQERVLAYTVAIRNAAEHPDTDADLQGDSWSLNPKTAQTYLRVALDTIRSVDARRAGRYEI